MNSKKYYISANTSAGFLYRLEENLANVNMVLTLRYTIPKNTAIIKGIIENNQHATPLEILKSPLQDDQLDGVILREKGIAIVGERLHPPVSFDKAYREFASGLSIHDKLEAIYIREMDFEKADNIADELIKKILHGIPKKTVKSTISERFLGTNTIDGVVNEVPSITKKLDYIYHIKGRAGTGKSTLMKRVAHACLNHGLDMEWYRCSFDPSSIDMVLIPDLKICLFDSTDPHAFEVQDVTREEIIDLYERTVTPGTDEKYAESIAEWTTAYKNHMKQGLDYLQEAGVELLQKEKAFPFTEQEIKLEIDRIQSLITF